MQHMSEKGTGGSPGCCRGIAGACEHTRRRGPGSMLLALHVPGGWCLAGQQTACLKVQRLNSNGINSTFAI